MKQREELCERLDKRLIRIASRPKEIQSIQNQLQATYDIPIDIANDYLTLRNNVVDATDFMLFVFTESLLKNELDKHFTASELKTFRQTKYATKKLKFPIRYKMVQVADDQWIGKITAQELILLRDAQIINYNEHTQRTMERVMSDRTEHYRIALNRRAVDAIVQSYKNNTYISNTLTLNLPIEAKYEYDEETGELVIYKSEDFKFDIIDGYHRYISISKLYNLNNNFDYNMELRIVQFDENKAKQFIWQEDQKTRMKKIDSEAMNVTAIPNKIIARLNSDPTFNLAGQISPNEGVINSGEFYLALNSLYKEEFEKKRQELQTVLRLTDYYKKFINMITEKDGSFMYKWDRKTTIAVTYTAHKEVSNKDAIKSIYKCRDILDAHPELLSKYQKNLLNGKDFRKLDELMA